MAIITKSLYAFTALSLAGLAHWADGEIGGERDTIALLVLSCSLLCLFAFGWWAGSWRVHVAEDDRENDL